MLQGAMLLHDLYNLLVCTTTINFITQNLGQIGIIISKKGWLGKTQPRLTHLGYCPSLYPVSIK